MKLASLRVLNRLELVSLFGIWSSSMYIRACVLYRVELWTDEITLFIY